MDKRLRKLTREATKLISAGKKLSDCACDLHASLYGYSKDEPSKFAMRAASQANAVRTMAEAVRSMLYDLEQAVSTVVEGDR